MGGGKAGEKREKLCNIVQYFAIKNAKRREPTNTGWELGLKGTGSGRFKPLCPPPPPSFEWPQSGKCIKHRE